MSKSQEPDRDIIRTANAGGVSDTTLLYEVMSYCWQQLQWRDTDARLLEVLDEMRAEIAAG